MNKGAALGTIGKLYESIYCYDKAIEINSKYEEVWYNKGSTLGNFGKIEEALHCYNKTLQMNQKHSGAWYNKGLILKKLGKNNDAIKAFQSYLKYASPQDALKIAYSENIINQLRMTNNAGI
jgi:tetratricopeptide (TPR) repeat protein